MVCVLNSAPCREAHSQKSAHANTHSKQTLSYIFVQLTANEFLKDFIQMFLQKCYFSARLTGAWDIFVAAVNTLLLQEKASNPMKTYKSIKFHRSCKANMTSV